MDEVADAVELVCKEQKGETLRRMATALVTAYLQTKMRDARTSVALYSISSDVDGAKIVQQIGTRMNKAIVRMLATSCEPLMTDPQLVASMLQGAMAGIGRRLVESDAAGEQFDVFREELVFVACAYLEACSARLPVQEDVIRKDAAKSLRRAARA
ncbi:hypothetical protein [Granulicella arctica]|uniref:Tetracyclin repressor SlmA-like C-terminal domain-containing protein n=1 Tax=Granulicella arctica TaxID=940613 RepID=A0A7Y9PJ74_9BACT|nr:hypothetical protein [Granulicella arctica]